jgi:hypothetical protein
VIQWWKLGSGVERNATYPQSFWIPSEEEKDSIIEGDLVKLMFEMRDGFGERMWAVPIPTTTLWKCGSVPAQLPSR